jgi:hypothetical protein
VTYRRPAVDFSASLAANLRIGRRRRVQRIRCAKVVRQARGNWRTLWCADAMGRDEPGSTPMAAPNGNDNIRLPRPNSPPSQCRDFFLRRCGGGRGGGHSFRRRRSMLRLGGELESRQPLRRRRGVVASRLQRTAHPRPQTAAVANTNDPLASLIVIE